MFILKRFKPSLFTKDDIGTIEDGCPRLPTS